MVGRVTPCALFSGNFPGAHGVTRPTLFVPARRAL